MAAKWAHAAMAIAVRTLAPARTGDAPDPATVLRMAERVMSEGDAARGAIGADLEPEDARALLGAWLRAVERRMSAGATCSRCAGRRLPPPRLCGGRGAAHERGSARAVADRARPQRARRRGALAASSKACVAAMA